MTSDGAQPVERVVARGLVSAVVALRATLELDPRHPKLPDLFARSLAWARDAGAWSVAEPLDDAIVAEPVGSLPPQRLRDAQWASEHVGVFAWALDRAPLPPWDAYGDATRAAQALGLNMPSSERPPAVALRPRGELEGYFLDLATFRWAHHERRLREIRPGDAGAAGAVRALLDERASVVGVELTADSLERARARVEELLPAQRAGEGPVLGLAVVREACMEWLLTGRSQLWCDRH